MLKEDFIVTDTRSGLLSDIDTKILLALTTEMNAFDALLTCGVSHAYGIKRIGHLYKHGWLVRRQEGKQYYYSTRLMPETESFFTIAQTATSKGPTFRLQNFFGQSMTFSEAINQELRRTNKLPGNLSLPVFLAKLISTIKVRSHNTAFNKPQQRPDENMLKDWLELYILQTKRNLKLAEEILSCRKLWDGSPTTWKWISENEPNETTVKAADDLNRLTQA